MTELESVALSSTEAAYFSSLSEMKLVDSSSAALLTEVESVSLSEVVLVDPLDASLELSISLGAGRGLKKEGIGNVLGCGGTMFEPEYLGSLGSAHLQTIILPLTLIRSGGGSLVIVVLAFLAWCRRPPRPRRRRRRASAGLSSLFWELVVQLGSLTLSSLMDFSNVECLDCSSMRGILAEEVALSICCFCSAGTIESVGEVEVLG